MSTLASASGEGICASALTDSRDNAEDEAVRDLKRHLLGQPDSLAPKAVSMNLERGADDLLHPEIGTVTNVATPGGFRRHHVRRSGRAGAYAQTVLTDILRPKIIFPGLDQEDDSAAADSKISNLSISIVILKCYMGSAFLIVPRGFSNAGLIGGPLMLLGMFCIEIFCMVKLIDCRERLNRPQRYEDLAACWHPTWGPRLVWGMIFLCEIGFICIWIVSQATNMEMLFPDWGLAARTFAFLPLYVPLVLVRQLKKFALMNLMGILICFIGISYLLYYCGTILDSSGMADVKLFNTANLDSLLWLGATAYVFEGVNMVLPMYESVEDKKSFPKLLVGLVFGLTVIYVTFGVCFYLAFGDRVEQLATLNLPPGTFWGRVLPLLFALVGVGTNPLNFFLCFQMLEPQIAWSDSEQLREMQKNVLRIAFTAFCFALTWVGGAELQNFLALIGGFCCASLALIIPSALHLTICKPTGLWRCVDYIIFVTGCSILVVCSGTAIILWK